MLRPITDVEWAHIDDLLGSGPRPNVVGAWLWLTGRMEISRTTFESRLRVRRLTARSAGQAHAASAASTEEPDGAHGHACTAAQTPAPCLAPTEDDAGALAPALAAMPQLRLLYLVGNGVGFIEALKRRLRWYEQELNRWNMIQLPGL